MRDGFRQSMTWLHTWGGLLFTWLLFAVFFTGTLSFYRDEITLWMTPELHRIAPGEAAGIEFALAELRQRAPQAKTWSITLPAPRNPATTVRWSNGRFDPKAVAVLDPNTGAVLAPRETRGGGFFRNFHFTVHNGVVGEWIVGIAAMVMFVALISGVIVHKKIFKDLFTFRPGAKSSGRAWLDAHNVAGVFSLPFYLMITYTGLVTLMYVYMPVGLELAKEPGSPNFFNALSLRPEAPKPRGEAAALTPLAPLLQQARQRWDSAEPGSLLIANPGDAAAVIDVSQRRGAGIAARTEPQLRFDGVSGVLLGDYRAQGAARVTYGVFYGLHVAWFAAPLLRGLLFLMGIGGCIMIASGALLWSAKRRERQRVAGAVSLGERLVDALNLAGIGGLVVASVAYFWINRLLPVGLDERIRAENTGFFLVWLACLAHALLRVRHIRAAWREQLWLAALLCALLPLLNAASGGLPLPQAMASGRWGIAGIDLAMLALVPLLWRTGSRIARPRVEVRSRRQARHRAAPEPAEESAA